MKIRVTGSLEIDEGELVFTASRSGGPGGQNVNKVSSKITLGFDVAHSPSLTEYQRGLILRALEPRLTQAGVLLISSSEARSQTANKESAVHRFVAVLAGALYVPKARRATKPTKGSQRRRLDEKKRASQRKSDRRTAND
jgi:ribosome-associated protein